MKAIVVDDEVHSARYLIDKLKQVWPELSIAGTAVNGRQALALVRDVEPDIVFLDIHMPGLSGLEVAKRLPNHSQVVFVTAFDQHAVQAFEQNAADYLLKPVTIERLAQTVERLQRNAVDEQNLELLMKQVARQENPFLQWLKVGSGEQTELISTQDVVYLQADQKYTSVFTADGEYLMRTPIKELAEALDPEKFWQVHRGIIVQVDQIAAAKRDLRGRYVLSLKSRGEKLRSSQAYGHLFKQM